MTVSNRFKERVSFSGVTNNRPLLVTGTNTTGAQTLHTSTSASGVQEYALIRAANKATDSNATIYISFDGGTNYTPFTIPPCDNSASGNSFPELPNKVTVADNDPISGGDTIKVYSPTASVITLGGFVIRYETAT